MADPNIIFVNKITVPESFFEAITSHPYQITVSAILRTPTWSDGASIILRDSGIQMDNESNAAQAQRLVDELQIKTVKTNSSDADNQAVVDKHSKYGLFVKMMISIAVLVALVEILPILIVGPWCPAGYQITVPADLTPTCVTTLNSTAMQTLTFYSQPELRNDILSLARANGIQTGPNVTKDVLDAVIHAHVCRGQKTAMQKVQETYTFKMWSLVLAEIAPLVLDTIITILKEMLRGQR